MFRILGDFFQKREAESDLKDLLKLNIQEKLQIEAGITIINKTIQLQSGVKPYNQLCCEDFLDRAHDLIFHLSKTKKALIINQKIPFLSASILLHSYRGYKNLIMYKETALFLIAKQMWEEMPQKQYEVPIIFRLPMEAICS